MKYKSLVIGLGQISLGYDYSITPLKEIKTHTQALSNHKNFELTTGSDPLTQKCDLFKKKYNSEFISNYMQALKNTKYDIIVIATPTTKHEEIFKNIMSMSPNSFVLIEKPLSCSVKSSRFILQLAEKNNIAFTVNYFREFEPTYRLIANKVLDGALGFPIKSKLKYNRGILNNASHFIMYVSNFYREFKNLELIRRYNQVNEFDTNLDINLEFENGNAELNYTKDINSYFQFEIEGPKGKLLFDNTNDKIYFKGGKDNKFNNLFRDNGYINSNLNLYQKFVYDNIFDHLKNKSELFCDKSRVNRLINIYDKIEKALK